MRTLLRRTLCSLVSRTLNLRPRNQRTRRVRLTTTDVLEARTLLAAVMWDGGGGDFSWNNPLNWSTDALPGASDNVTIDFGSNDFTVEHLNDSTLVNSLDSQASLLVSGGSLALINNSIINRDLTVSSILESSAVIAVAGSFTWNGGALRGTGSLTAHGGTQMSGSPFLWDGFEFINPVGQTVTWSGPSQVNLRTGSEFTNNGCWTSRVITRWMQSQRPLIS